MLIRNSVFNLKKINPVFGTYELSKCACSTSKILLFFPLQKVTRGFCLGGGELVA